MPKYKLQDTLYVHDKSQQQSTGSMPLEKSATVPAKLR